MKEILKVKQDSDYCKKRWFSSSDVDLFVWLNKDNVLERFQLCYDKFMNEHAFIWSNTDGYRHYAVSDGEDNFGMTLKFSPIFIDKLNQQRVPKDKLIYMLKKHANLEKTLFKQILIKIKECPFNQCWYLYMIRASDNSLYTGITTDIDRRFAEHQSSANKGAKYFRGKTDLQLVFRYEFDTRSTASSYEAKVKKLNKVKKEMLVNGEIKILELMSKEA